MCVYLRNRPREEELATPSRSATPSHVDTGTRKEKRKRTAEQKKEFNRRQRQNKEKRLKTDEKAVPALSAGVRVADSEDQNTALTATLQERELRVELLAQHLEDKKGECATAKEAQRVAEQAARDCQSALLLSEAWSLALKGELATAADRISCLDSEVAQLRLALTIANASVASSAVLYSLALGVARDLASLADEVTQEPPAVDTRSSSPSLSFHADSPGSFERDPTPTPDVRPFSPSPPLGFLDP